jgi:putative protein kinase ArgK-like GTPase of G3E family
VSILTDDQQGAAIAIIGLMFGRWIQENDFKYLDKHFGINQITSYGVTGYDELRAQVEDRQVRSAEAKALQEQRRQLRAKQSRLLLVEAKGEHEQTQRQQRIKALEEQPDADQAKKELARLRQGQAAGKALTPRVSSRSKRSVGTWRSWTPRASKPNRLSLVWSV